MVDENHPSSFGPQLPSRDEAQEKDASVPSGIFGSGNPEYFRCLQGKMARGIDRDPVGHVTTENCFLFLLV